MNVYCDASFENNKTVLSVVIFNNEDCIYEKAVAIKSPRNSFEAEFYAIKEAITTANKLKINNFTLYSDGKGNVAAINFKSPKKYKCIVNEIKSISCKLDVTFEWIPRSKNCYADKLGKKLVI